MFDQLGYTFMAPSKYVKLKLIYGFDNSNSDYVFEIVFKNNGNRGQLSSLTVQTFLTGVLTEVLGPIIRLQSELIKWKFVSILYPNNSTKNLLKLPIRNLRGRYGKSESFRRQFKVSLRFVGLTNSTCVSIYGIPDEIAFLEDSNGGDDSTDTDFSSALQDCEQIFLKQHTFRATFPAVSISYVHPSRVVEKTVFKGSSKKKGSKEGAKKMELAKRSKKTSKIIYRIPVIAMYLY